MLLGVMGVGDAPEEECCANTKLPVDKVAMSVNATPRSFPLALMIRAPFISECSYGMPRFIPVR
jgi:hypothetical protein